MKKVDYGAFVKLCYTGKLKNGLVFEKTVRCKPVEIQVGRGSKVAGFEDALIGMGPNEKKSFVLGPNEAYGDRDENLERRFVRENLGLQFEPYRGQVILFMTDDGQLFPAVIKFVDDRAIVADFNHPLAGRELAFEVEVAEINEAQDESQSRCEAECCCS